MPNPKKKQTDPFPFAYKQVRDPKTGEYSYVRLVSPQIPDYILSTGNSKLLTSFYEKHMNTLTDADRKYMRARIRSAWKTDQLQQNAVQNIGRNIEPVRPEITTKKGYTGIDLKYNGPQTSNNGCWSQGMSLLLKSRGIDMTQEEIRAWRPDFSEGEEQSMSEERRFSMDYDGLANVHDKADLIHKVLPNTGVTTVTLNGLPENFHLSNQPQMDRSMRDFMTDQEWEAAEQEYNRQYEPMRENARKVWKAEMKKQFGQIVRSALNRDRSPIVMNIGANHYVTITGISENGNRIRYEDSMRSLDKTTQTMSVDDLIENYMISRPMKDMYGITLTWLRDLPAPKYENRETQQTDVARDYPNASSVDAQGNIRIREPENTTISARSEPDPKIGHLSGQELTDSLTAGQEEISNKLGGGMIYADNMQPELYGVNKLVLGSMQTYLPKKVLFYGDPALENGKLQEEPEDEPEEEVNLFLQDIEDLGPDEGSLGAYIDEHKQELLKQNPDTAYFIARIYAANQFLEEKNAAAPVHRDTLILTDEDRRKIEEQAQKITPVVNGILALPKGKIHLPMMAANDEIQKLNTQIENFTQRYRNGANQNLADRRDAIDDAFQAMYDTGTGKNYLGITRSANKTEYTEMMEALAAYREELRAGRVPDGVTNYNLIQKCLKYIDNKKTVRSTGTGVIRFDNTMQILKQLMPPAEYSVLCNKINRARGVSRNVNDEDYISADRYSPVTASRYIKQQCQRLASASGTDLKNRLARIIAAREIAVERDRHRGMNAVIVHSSDKKADEARINTRMQAIKADPAFRTLVRNIPEDPEEKTQALRRFVANDGRGLEEEYATQRLLAPQRPGARPLNAGGSGPQNGI